MKRVALCIATYEHPDVVQDVLDKCIEDYYRCGIDIYYYDSSTTDDTKCVVEDFVKQGYTNLYYLKLDSHYNADDKVDMIFAGYGLNQEYDYIWPSKDRTYCSAETLLRVVEAMEEGHDLIMMGALSGLDMDSITYSVAKEFYRDWGKVSTSLDALIYKYSSMLKDYDSDAFAQLHPEDYIVSWRAFVHVYNKLCEMEEYSIKVLPVNTEQWLNSSLGKSGWEKRVFTVWKDYWLQANDNLPAYYDEYKAEVIKETASLPWIFGGVTQLMKLHTKGILVPEKLEEVEKNWERVSDIPIEKVRKIAQGIYNFDNDMDLLGRTGIETIDLLVQIYKVVNEGQMKIEEIPVYDILYLVEAAFVNKYTQNCRFIGIFMGSIQDIAADMKKSKDKDAICKSLKLLINLLLLLEC